MSAGRKSTSQLPIPRKLTLPSKQQEQVEEREDEDPDILDAVIQKGMRQKQRVGVIGKSACTACALCSYGNGYFRPAS